MINILFVCMGNICRSPSAEGFFADALNSSSCKDLVSIDSAGTHGYHVGHTPDARAAAMALNFGVDISHLRARKVSVSDFDEYDLIIAMDRDNLEDLQRIQPAGSRARLKMMMQYHPEGKPEEVPDPYYGSTEAFYRVFQLIDSAVEGLIFHIADPVP